MEPLTAQQLTNQYRLLSTKLKNFLDSAENLKLVDRIGGKHFLDEEDSRVLASSVGLVLLGFIKPHELFQEINDYLEADEKTVTEVIREINRQIFIPFHKELENLYKLDGHIEDKLLKEEINPVIGPQPKKEETKERQTRGEISLETLGREKPTQPVRVGVEGEKPAEGQPLIIHTEESLPVQTGKKPFKGLEFPFGFFGKEGEPAPSEPVKVRVEMPKEKRVVHYSELRTPLAPFQKPEEIINLETFGRKPQEVKAPAEVVPPKNAAPETKPQPKIEGNVVDLRE